MSDQSPLCAPKRTSADHSKFLRSRLGLGGVAKPSAARPMAGKRPDRQRELQRLGQFNVK
jgi:hypothetical protein